MVRVGGHDVAHMAPPLLAFRGLGDGLPLGFVLDLCIGEQLMGLRMEKDGVVMCPVLLEDGFQIRPDRIVAFFVLLFFSSVNGHYESLSDHFHEFVSMSSAG